MTDFEIINLIIANASEGGGGFNWRFVFEHTVNLLLLLGVIFYFVKTPIKSFLVERRSTISSEIDKAQRAITQAKESYEKYAEKFKGIEGEIASLKEALRKQGKNEREEIIKQAGATGELLSKEAKEMIELETLRARREIQSEVVTLAVKIAENIIKQNLGEADKERLLEQFTKNIEEEKWHQSQH